MRSADGRAEEWGGRSEGIEQVAQRTDRAITNRGDPQHSKPIHRRSQHELHHSTSLPTPLSCTRMACLQHLSFGEELQVLNASDVALPLTCYRFLGTRHHLRSECELCTVGAEGRSTARSGISSQHCHCHLKLPTTTGMRTPDSAHSTAAHSPPALTSSFRCHCDELRSSHRAVKSLSEPHSPAPTLDSARRLHSPSIALQADTKIT